MAHSLHICLFSLTLFYAFTAATRQRLISNNAAGFALEKAGINANAWSVQFSDIGSSCSCSSPDNKEWEDPRVKEALLLFDRPFSSIPSVMISVTKIHTLKTADTHYEAKAVSVSTTGFILQFRVFDDTYVKDVEIDWMAIGSLL